MKEMHESVNVIENKLFNYLNDIVKDKSKHGTIIVSNDNTRGVGKTHSIKALHYIYGINVGRKYFNPDIGVKLNTNQDYLRGKVYDSTPWILDEGFTLSEVNILKEYYNIIFAIVSDSSEYVKLEEII